VYADHWVYTRLEDRPGLTADKDKGRSKKGDIIAVREVGPTTVPSATASAEWHIVQVEGLTKADIVEMTISNHDIEPNGEAGKVHAYRKKKLDESWTDGKTKGKKVKKIKAKDLKDKLRDKTPDDFAKYERQRKWFAYVQHPINLAMNLFTPRAWGASSHTCNKSGEDYDTITLWEDANDGVLSGVIKLTLFDDDGTLTDQVFMAGSTTSSSNYMFITVNDDDWHKGVIGTGFEMEGPNDTADTITMDDSHIDNTI